MNHTPGPWAAEHELGTDEDGHEHAVWAVHGSHFSVYVVGENDESDAYLIAAAPDLLEAIEGLMEIAQIAMPDTYFASDSRVAKARVAIAKATGET